MARRLWHVTLLLLVAILGATPAWAAEAPSSPGTSPSVATSATTATASTAAKTASAMSATAMTPVKTSASTRSGPKPTGSVGPLGIVVPKNGKFSPRFYTTSPLTYHGGNTMHTNTTYAIFWIPSGFTVDAQYVNLIAGYFQNVALASGQSTNVYDVATQYYDTITGSQRNILYQSTFGGYIIDTSPFPVSGCTDPTGTEAVCLTDPQLEQEISNAITGQGWSPALTKEFFLFTPHNVASCTDAVNNICSTNTFCAYHSNFFLGGPEVIYANQPYDADFPVAYGTCDTGQHPNGDDADITISDISHEANESITDPDFGGWYAGDGSHENGDECAYVFGNPIGSTAFGKYNQIIGTGKYYIQQEWSNAAYNGTNYSGCLQEFPAGGTYTPLTPARILDTRSTSPIGPYNTPFGQGVTRPVQVAGQGGIPSSGASAVVLNVTATNTTAQGWLTIWPTGQPQPLASSLNFTANETIPNLVEVELGSGGQISVFNAAGNTDVFIDVEGWVSQPNSTATAGRVNPLTPARILDTRAASQIGPYNTPFGPGTVRNVQVNGQGGVPSSGVSAVVLNITVTNTTATSFLTVWPAGVSQPIASNLNWVAGKTIPNRVMVPVGSSGQISVYNGGGNADVLIDVNGWYTDNSFGGAGTTFTGMTPSRLIDTRFSSPVGPGQTLTVQVAGQHGVPSSGVTAVVLNVTVVDTTTFSWLTVYPTGVAQPGSSDLNWTAGVTIPNMVVVALGANGQINVFNAAGNTDVIIDVAGYYS